MENIRGISSGRTSLGTGAAVSTVSKSDPAKPSRGFGSVIPPTCCTGVSAQGSPKDVELGAVIWMDFTAPLKK